MGAAEVPQGVADLAGSLRAIDAHTGQVCRLALGLFDALNRLHGLGARERMLLQCGAMLHDIGLVGGRKGHHTRASAMILEAGGTGLGERDREMVALLARYHRKAPPSPEDPVYRDLDPAARKVLDWLAGILRVADGLDRTHGSVVGEMGCTVGPGSITLECRVSCDAAEELFHGLRKGDLLEKASKRRLEIVMERSEGRA